MTPIPTSRPRARSCSSSRSSGPRFLAGLLLAALLLAAGVGAQTEPGADPARDPADDDAGAKASTITEYAQVDLVLVEAVVLDRRGRHVRGLDRDAFRLRLGDREIPLLTFDEIDLTRRGVAGSVAAESLPPTVEPEAGRPAGDEQTAPPPADRPPGEPSTEPLRADAPAVAVETRRRALAERLQGPRWFLMVFDGYNNVSPLRMSQLRRAAKNWLDANLRDGDMVAVYEFNPYLSSISGFTNDVWQLKEAIDKARMFPASSMGRELVAQRLEQGDAIPREFLEQQLLNASQFGADLMRAERDQFYTNVQNLSDVLGGLKGTKAILMFSGGFPLTRTRDTSARGGFTTRFKNMIKALEARGIRVFTFDVGVEGYYTDAAEDTNFRVDLENLGFGHEWLDSLQIGWQLDSVNAHHEILFVLGNETGGRFWRGKDYKSGLAAADDDLSHYYLLGYRPPDPDALDARARQRGYLPLKIDVKGGGLKVVSRQGNFLPTAQEAARERDREALQAAWGRGELGADAPLLPGDQQLTLSCRPQFYPANGGETLVVLPVRVQGDLPVVALAKGEATLDFDIRVAATKEGDTFQEGSRNVRLSFPADKKALLADGVQLREAMLLPPGVYELVVQFRLNGMSRSGEWRHAARVPGRALGKFGLTDLALLDPRGATPTLYDVFRKRDNVFGTDPPAPLPDPLGDGEGARPPHYLDGGFSRSVPLLAQVQVTAPPPPRSDERSPLSMDWELLPAGGGASIVPPVQYRRLQMTAEGQRLDVLVDLNLTAVEPGDYTLRLTAKNLSDDAEDVRSHQITIAP